MDKIEQLCKRNKAPFYRETSIKAYNLKAKYYTSIGDYVTSKNISNQVIENNKATIDSSLLLPALVNLGLIAEYQGDYEDAIQIDQQILAYFERKGNTDGIARISTNIGNVYIRLERFNEALPIYLRGIQIFHDLHNEEKEANAMANLSRVYKGLKDRKNELKYKLLALEKFTQIGDINGVALVSGNLGVYYANGDYKKSLAYYRSAIMNYKKLSNRGHIAYVYSNLSDLYFVMNDKERAMACIDSSILISSKNGDKLINSEAILNKAILLATMEKYSESDSLKDVYTSIRNDIFSQKMQSKVADMSVKYETEKKQKVIQQQIFELKKRSFWLTSLSIIIPLLLIVGYFIFKNIRHKQEKQLQLEAFKQQEMAGRALFEGEQNERIRIARDLHDSIGQRLSVMKMKINALPESKEVIAMEFFLDGTLQELRHISHNLIPESLNFGLLKALEDLCENSNAKHSTHISLKSKLPENVIFDKQTELSIYRIVQEIIGNTLKHAQAKHLNISCSSISNQINIISKDDGKGFDIKQMKQSTGIGWQNVLARTNLLSGKMTVTSQQNIDTEILITIPYHDK